MQPTSTAVAAGAYRAAAIGAAVAAAISRRSRRRLRQRRRHHYLWPRLLRRVAVDGAAVGRRRCWHGGGAEATGCLLGELRGQLLQLLPLPLEQRS